MGFILFFNTVILAILCMKVLLSDSGKEVQELKEELELLSEKLEKLEGEALVERHLLRTVIKAQHEDVLERLENSRQYVLKLEKELKGKK
jgi:hypothetical protein